MEKKIILTESAKRIIEKLREKQLTGNPDSKQAISKPADSKQIIDWHPDQEI